MKTAKKRKIGKKICTCLLAVFILLNVLPIETLMVQAATTTVGYLYSMPVGNDLKIMCDIIAKLPQNVPYTTMGYYQGIKCFKFSGTDVNGENRIIYVQPSAMLQKTQGEWFDNDILASFDIASNLNKKNYKATYLYKAHYYRDKRVESDSVTWFYRYFISFYKVNADYVTNDEIDIRIEATKSYEFYLTIGTNAIYNIGDYEATVEVEPSINLTVENTGTAAVYLTKQKLVGMCGRSRSQEIGAIVDIGYHVGKLAASVYTNGLLGYGSALKLYNLLSTTTTASADKEKDLYGWIYITRNGKYGYSTGISGGYNISRTGQHLTLMVCGMGNGQLHLSNGTMQVKIRI